MLLHGIQTGTESDRAKLAHFSVRTALSTLITVVLQRALLLQSTVSEVTLIRKAIAWGHSNHNQVKIFPTDVTFQAIYHL